MTPSLVIPEIFNRESTFLFFPLVFVFMLSSFQGDYKGAETPL